MTSALLNFASPQHRVAVRAALAAAFFATVTIAPAIAGERMQGDMPRQITVRYTDLNLQTDTGAATLYQRLKAASRRVCPDNGRLNLQYAQAVRECRADALARAISNVGSERLAALQTGRKRVG